MTASLEVPPQGLEDVALVVNEEEIGHGGNIAAFVRRSVLNRQTFGDNEARGRSVTEALQTRARAVTDDSYGLAMFAGVPMSAMSMQPSSVGLLVCAADGADEFAVALEREVGVVARLSSTVVDSDESGVPAGVTLCWLPAQAAWEMLTDVSGWCRRAPRRCGLIALIPAGDVSDRETALVAGFDDVVVGPLSVKEVAARARALGRRLRMTASERVGKASYGPFTIDFELHQLSSRGQRVEVTRRELAVMAALVEAQGGARSRSEILEAAWGHGGADVGDRAVDNVILRLRRKLGVGSIVTVRGVGFRLADGGHSGEPA